MAIKNKSEPKIGSSSAGRTTVTVLIDTHDRGEHHGNQRIDLSEYINQVAIDAHLDGGSSAQIGLPAIDHIEDIIAAGDLINIYFNLHRGDSNVYNKGRVRVFFGYVDIVAKSVSVSGDGSKLTSYTISCRDFSKAIRGTYVYSNPHIASHGGEEGTDNVIRNDFNNNLGGLTVLDKGIALQGTPRQIIIRNLMRTLGWGGQMVLPDHYREKLSGGNLGIKITHTGGDGEFSSSDFDVDLPEEPKSSLSFISNTFFQIGGGVKRKGKTTSSLFERKDGILNTNLKAEVSKIVADTAAEAFSISGKNVVFQKVNHYPEPAGEMDLKESMTMFNILCLDYLEEVDGYWGDISMKDFNGSVYSSLYDASNESVNEFFFDLRPAPLFVPKEKDGLGVKIGGALPMVPAVILREKPFTNYPIPANNVTTATEGQKVVVGGLKSPNSTSPSDQLFIDFISTSSSKVVTSTEDTLSQEMNSQLEGIGLEATVAKDAIDNAALILALSNIKSVIKTSTVKVDAFNDKSFEGETDEKKLLLEQIEKEAESDPTTYTRAPWLKDLVNWLKSEEPDIASLQAGVPNIFGVVPSEQLKDMLLSEKGHSTIVSLPRPIFRSPDGKRLTLEKKMGAVQKLLGMSVISEDGDSVTTNFLAFSHGNPTGSEQVETIEETVSLGGGSSDGTAVLSAGSSIDDVANDLELSSGIKWHILDFMSVYDVDVISENYYRGDQQVVNILEVFPDLPGNTSNHRLYWNNHMPMVTPVSVFRHGLRPSTHHTKFVQHLLTGDLDWTWHKSQLMRWSIMLDMWTQHAHEYLTGSMSLVGMPGIRPGYRVDRPEMGMSFYVERVSHKWSYPGNLTTHIGVIRGQPSPEQPSDPTTNVESKGGTGTVLKYYPPEADIAPNLMSRNFLGKIFSAGAKLQKAGSYTGSVLEIEGRKGGPIFKYVGDVKEGDPLMKDPGEQIANEKAGVAALTPVADVASDVSE